MFRFTPSIVTALLLLSSTVRGGTWAPAKFAVIDAATLGVRNFFFLNGTIQELASSGTPGNTAGYSTWSVDNNFGEVGPGVIDPITNVAPSSDFAGLGYISTVSENWQGRLFYQTTSGDIRSVINPGATQWQLDPTIIATVPLGAPISAFHQSNSAGEQAIIVQYTDSEGLLTQRFSTTDAGNWSAPVTITTS
ncbi:hypothetical protein K439DRAFT_1612662 [Ramaria rubella]|nr:hypothetical protein K439DRAFT_1612662 [Ramaria rubella]